MNKTALITGINGQDGSYLAELLLKKRYKVHGIIRRSSVFNTERIDHIFDKLYLTHGDITDASFINNIIKKIKPDEIYNLAAQSHVGISFEIPKYTSEVDGIGTLNILEAIKNSSPESKLYQASTSELFGKVLETPQTETTPFNPQSPYAIAKLYSYWICKNYKEAYGLDISQGILFNHSSPRRTPNFILRKITYDLSKVARGEKEYLEIGNLDSKRDIGYAKDYVKAMWMMLQHDKADDFVICTGNTYSVRQLIEITGLCIGMEISWQGEGLNEVGINEDNGKCVVKVNKKYFRPTEVDLLQGDYSKAKKELGWEPETNIYDLIELMVTKDFFGLERKQV